MRKIKASVIRELRGKFKTEELYIDEPKALEVLIDVKASGLCHSDLHLVNEGFGILNQFPAVLGHEIAGVVAAVGEGVTEFKPGDHVAASLIQFCGMCESCLSGETYYCTNRNFTLRKPDEAPRLKDKADKPVFQGFGISGFSQMCLVHQNQLAKIPKEIEFSKACILGCGTITGAGAIINTAKVRPGDAVAIIGIGGVGLNAISGARVSGATPIIAIDVQDEKLELAKKFGATHVINSKKEDPIKKVFEITGGGVKAAFEVIGMKTTAEQAIAMTKLGGGAYLIGLQDPKTHVQLPGFEGFTGMGREVKGVWMGSTNIKKDIPMYAKLYLEGRMNLDDLVSKEINIDEVQEAYENLGKGNVIGRTVITSFE